MMKSVPPYHRLHLIWLIFSLTSPAAIGTAHDHAAENQAAGVPEVLNVDPPNWWAGHSINPVRLLIRGRNLAGARVVSPRSKMHIGLTRSNATGSYLFVDVRIDPNAPPGAYPLQIVTDRGRARAAFELHRRLNPVGRFQGFSPEDVVYLLMVDRFANGDPSNDDPPMSRGLYDRHKTRYYHGGDLQGIIDHLPYLKDLGVTAIWISPIYDNVNHQNEHERYNDEAITDYHGYGAVDFYAVEEHFGDLAKFRQLVDAAHRRGMRVIQDSVANHTGPAHPWLKDPPTPTWFNGTPENHLANTWQTWTLMDPHATPRMQEATLRGWFIDILPDLNQNDEETARYIIQNTLWWIGMTGLDGIRQDTLPYVPRRFWRDWMAAIKREYPQFTVVGELFDGDPSLVSFFQGGQPRFDGIDSGIDVLLDFPLFFPLRRAFAQGKPIRQLAMMLGHDHLYVNSDKLMTFLGNHDVERFMNRQGATIEGLKLAYTFILTARGIPQLYYGDEIALPGGGDPDNRRDFPGGWPGDPANAFDLSGRTIRQRSVFDHVRRLTRLRAQLDPLRRGSMINLAVDEQTYAYARMTDGDAVLVIFNNGTKPATIEFDVGPVRFSEGVILEDRLGMRPDVHVEGGKMRFHLPARWAAVYTVKTD